MNVLAYLKDIDDEITAHRQEIAKRQVRIQQLEDMRLLMMNREEERAQANGLASPFGTFPNGGAVSVKDPRLQIPKRDYTAEYERRMELADRRSEGSMPPPKKRRSDYGMKKGVKADQTERNRNLRRDILDAFADRPAMTSSEVIHALGMETKQDKQRIYNALRGLLGAGDLYQEAVFGPYSIAPSAAAA